MGRTEVSAKPEAGNGSLAFLVDQVRKAFRPDATGEARVTVQIVLVGEVAGRLWIEVGDERLEVGEGPRSAPDVTFELTGADLAGLVERRLNPDLLVLEDRLRIGGDLSRALGLRKLLRASH